MKKLLGIIVFIFLSFHVAAEELFLGQSLNNLSAGIQAKSLERVIDLKLWPENKVYIYKKSETTSLAVSENFFPFGVISKEPEGTFLYISSDGRGKIDLKTKEFYVPFWVIKLNSKNIDGSYIDKFLDKLYQIFQSDQGMKDSETIKAITTDVINSAHDPEFPDRDLIYLYQLIDSFYSSSKYDICLEFLEEFDHELTGRTHHGSSPVTMINLIETLFRKNDLEGARQIDELLLSEKPDCIPALVYQAILENDPEKNRVLKQVLLTKYPNHWLVKEKIAL